MTKETKIGLLVGLGIILIIGIVVTDHLSFVAHQDPANLIDFAPEAYEATFTPRTPGQTGSPPSPSSSLVTNTPTPPPANASANRHRPPTSTAESSRVIPTPQEATPTHQTTPPSPHRPVPAHYSLEIVPAQRIVLGNAPQAATDTPQSQTNPNAAVRAVGNHQTLLSPLAIRETAAANRAAEFSPPPIRSGNNDTRSTPPPTATTTASLTPTRSSTKPIYHTVRDGESLYEIAQKYYENGNYWRTLREANPAVVGSDGQIRAGIDLLVPNKAGLVRKSIAHRNARQNKTTITPTRSPSPPHTSSKHYAVREGDTLSSIAVRELKNEKKWYALFQANRKLLKDDPDSLQVGMKLILP